MADGIGNHCGSHRSKSIRDDVPPIVRGKKSCASFAVRDLPAMKSLRRVVTTASKSSQNYDGPLY